MIHKLALSSMAVLILQSCAIQEQEPAVGEGVESGEVNISTITTLDHAEVYAGLWQNHQPCSRNCLHQNSGYRKSLTQIALFHLSLSKPEGTPDARRIYHYRILLAPEILQPQ
jgi:hypothetical protein